MDDVDLIGLFEACQHIFNHPSASKTFEYINYSLKEIVVTSHDLTSKTRQFESRLFWN
jgi:hypothetical protein